MDNEKAQKCPQCGNEMLKAKHDGTIKFNGKVNYSGYYCPKCSAASNTPEDAKE